MPYGIDEFVTHFDEAPVVEVRDGIALIRGRSGGVSVARSLSLKSLAKLGERVQLALRRHASGEHTIIVDD